MDTNANLRQYANLIRSLDEIPYRAQGRQQTFHECDAQEVLYGGAAGGGKTEALLNDAVKYCRLNAGAQAGLFRRTFPELEMTLIKRFLSTIPSKFYKYDKTKHVAVFEPFTPGSSQLSFNYCQNEDDVYRYQSAEFQYLGFDELTHFTEFQYTYLLSRLRSSKAGYKLKVRSGTNPGNIGHAWVKSRFIENLTPEEIWTDTESGMTRCFIPAKIADNPALVKADPTYLKRLQGLPNDNLKKALIEGDWDIFDGQYFASWRKDRHVVEPFEIPWQNRWFGHDFGYANPSATLWIARDNDDRLWVYREIYEAKLTEGDLADKMLRFAQGDCDGLCDPSIFAKTRQGQTAAHDSIAETFIKKGLRIQPANNDRIAGWNRLRSYLQEGPACHIHRDLGFTTCPKLHIFSTCKDLIRTLPQMIHDPKRPEDLDTTAEDHAVDALRYALMGAPERQLEPKIIGYEEGLGGVEIPIYGFGGE